VCRRACERRHPPGGCNALEDFLTEHAHSGAATERPKTLAEAKAWMHQRLASRFHPMNALDLDDGPALIEGVPGLDGATWGSYWGAQGDAAWAQARSAQAQGNAALAQRLLQKATGLYFMGRFPCPNHPAKQHCAERERETYIALSAHWAEPIERVAIAFDGRADEGREVVALVRRPKGVPHPPVVIMWGGVDACKEQMTAASDALLARGVATVAIDNAGTGESPVRGVPDAERQFITVMDWVQAQPGFHATRVGLLGRSFGGYWATKLAHLLPERIAGAVNWGGGAHHMFQPGWIAASRYPDSYLMELVETRCRMLGAANDAEYTAFFQRLSLLDQGLLDTPCAPLLLVNGKEDKQCPVADIHLLTEHGAPKTVRLFPGGHMGLTPQTLPTIVDWLHGQVGQQETHAGAQATPARPAAPQGAHAQATGPSAARPGTGAATTSGRNWRQDMPTPDAYWMNRVLFDVHHQASHLERYLHDPDAYMATVPLAPELKAAIRDNHIGAMYLAGVNPYLLRAHCLGLRIPEKTFLESLRAIASQTVSGTEEHTHG
jgi:esterase FrsA